MSSCFTHISAAACVVAVAQGDGLGAVVLVAEDGDEEALGAGPFADAAVGAGLGEALELVNGAQIVDVSNAEGLEEGGTVIGETRGLCGAEDDARLEDAAGLGVNRVATGITKVGEAGDGDEGRLR